MVEQLAWGLQITAVGMGLVFALLALLWGMLVLVLRFDPDPAALAAKSAAAATAADAGGAAEAGEAQSGEVIAFGEADPDVGVADAEIGMRVAAETGLGAAPETAEAIPAGVGAIDPDLLAAITVAVVTHRAQRRRQAAPAMRSYWPGSLLYASRWVGTGRARQNFYWRRRGK